MGDTELDSAPHSSDDSSTSLGQSARRKLLYSQRPHPPEIKAVKRIQKNARERQRVAQVRNQYNVLRRTLGDDFRTQKVNKVKTLHGAIEYIKGLTNEFEHLRSAGPSRVVFKVSSRLHLHGKSPNPLPLYLCNSRESTAPQVFAHAKLRRNAGGGWGGDAERRRGRAGIFERHSTRRGVPANRGTVLPTRGPGAIFHAPWSLERWTASPHSTGEPHHDGFREFFSH